MGTTESAFEKASKNLVQELSKKGKLIHVDNPMESTYFSPYYLVREKTKGSSYFGSPYISLKLTLKDILDPSFPEPEVTQVETFSFTHELDGQLSGSMKMTSSEQVMISGEFSVSDRTDLEVTTLSVSPITWDCLQMERKLKKPEPAIIQQLQKQGMNLYVVTDAVKTQKEIILKNCKNMGGFGKINLSFAFSKVESRGCLNTVKTVKVPAGSILAFQVAQLIIGDDWTVLQIPEENQKTFIPEGTDREMMGKALRVHKPVTDFEKLQAETESEQGVLTMMDRKVKQLLLQALVEFLQSEQNLLDLEAMIEESLFTGIPSENVEGIKGQILSNLQDENGELVQPLAGSLLYFLGALNGLSDMQQHLLIQLLEKNDKVIMMVEAKVVQYILERNFNQTEESTFSFSSEAKSFFEKYDEKLTFTRGLLEVCGLELSGDEPQITWNPSVLHSFCALYGSLVMMLTLLEAY